MTHVGLVLKAAAALTSQSATTIANTCGLKRARVQRIIAGRTCPTLVEVEDILRACGLDPRLITIPCGGGGGWREKLTDEGRLLTTVLSDTQLLGSLLLSGMENHALPQQGHRLVIDKLWLTFNVVDDAALVRLLAKQHDKEQPKEKSYKLTYDLPGIRIQHGDPPEEQNDEVRSQAERQKRRSSRLAFHSSKSFSVRGLQANEHVLAPLFRLIDEDSLRITRVDAAVDLPISIRDVQALDDRSQKAHRHVGHTGVETITFGTRTSNRQIQIYDGRKKRIEVEGRDESEPVRTRFEARLLSPRVKLFSLGELSNPFTTLALLLLRPAGSLQERLLVAYARFFGIVALKDSVEHGELSSADYEAVVQRARVDAESAGIAHPAVVFQKEWRHRVERLLHRFRKLGLGGGR